MPGTAWGFSFLSSFAGRSSTSMEDGVVVDWRITNSQTVHLVELAQNITVTEESILLLINLEGSASILRKQHAVSNLAVHGDQLSVAVHSAGTNSQNLRVRSERNAHSSLVGLRNRSLRKKNAGSGLQSKEGQTANLGLSHQSLHQHSISKRNQLILRPSTLRPHNAYHIATNTEENCGRVENETPASKEAMETDPNSRNRMHQTVKHGMLDATGENWEDGRCNPVRASPVHHR